MGSKNGVLSCYVQVEMSEREEIPPNRKRAGC